MFFYCLSFSQEFSWGDTTKIGVSKSFVDGLIKKYVEEKYPEKVQSYQESLEEIRKAKLEKYQDIIYLADGLMWQDDKSNKELKMNVLEATRYCRNLVHASKKDWRLPEYNELIKLVNYFRYEPAVQDEIEHISADRYWSISNDITDYSATWYVDFKYGETGVAIRTNRYNVRCVRDLSNAKDDF